jgi:hypothetical protein
MSAAKQRRYRARQRNDKFVLRVEASSDIVRAFLAAEWITPDEALDRSNIERLAADVLRYWGKEWLIAKGER